LAEKIKISHSKVATNSSQRYNSNMFPIEIHNKTTDDDSWVKSLIEEHWGSLKIVTRGKITQADRVSGFVACIDNKPIGLITYVIDKNNLEIITLNSEMEGVGIGTALINTVINFAKDQKYKRVWVITTNDNQPAINFYKKRGFLLKANYENAIEESRKIKPEIPMIGIGGIPIKDELEFEFQIN
jgi:ribosomal protein S18 acetylase RimI-like enzyme